jgi:hypothetical protein
MVHEFDSGTAKLQTGPSSIENCTTKSDQTTQNLLVGNKVFLLLLLLVTCKIPLVAEFILEIRRRQA